MCVQTTADDSDGEEGGVDAGTVRVAGTIRKKKTVTDDPKRGFGLQDQVRVPVDGHTPPIYN